jgi:hypothetical protein
MSQRTHLWLTKLTPDMILSAGALPEAVGHNNPITIQHQVAWFDVTVGNLLIVGILQPHGRLRSDSFVPMFFDDRKRFTEK